MCWRWRVWLRLACCLAVCCPGANKLCRAVSIQAYTGSLGTFLNLSLCLPPVYPSVSLYPLTDSRLWGALLSILHTPWAPQSLDRSGSVSPQWVNWGEVSVCEPVPGKEGRHGVQNVCVCLRGWLALCSIVWLACMHFAWSSLLVHYCCLCLTAVCMACSNVTGSPPLPSATIEAIEAIETEEKDGEGKSRTCIWA